MKKLLFLPLALLVVTAANAQVKSKGAQTSLQYDSMVNFVGPKPQLLKGQTLRLKESEEAEAAGGYEGFMKRADPDFATAPSNVYKRVPAKSGFYSVSDYDFMRGRDFIVTGIVQQNATAATSNMKVYTLELQEKETGDRLYYDYDGYNADLFNEKFIVVGYMDKMKKLLVGRDFVYTGKEFDKKRSADYRGLRNVENGTLRTDIPAGTSFHCEDVVLEDGNQHRLVAVLSNPTFGSVYTLTADLLNTSGADRKFTTTGDMNNAAIAAQKQTDDIQQSLEARKKEYIMKFGQENGTLIAEGKVKVGMTKEMCILAMGQPLGIATIQEGKDLVEQWEYVSGDYLYLRNGILIRTNFVQPYIDGVSSTWR